MTKTDYTEFTPEERAVIRRLIRQNRRKWTAISVVWILFAAFVIYAYLQNKERSREGQRAFHVQCVAKANAAEELTDTKRYLRDHPKGTKDIPLAFIKSSIARTQRTLHNLESLNCPNEVKANPGVGFGDKGSDKVQP